MPQSCVKQVASMNSAPWEEEEKILWKTESIHGMYHCQTGEMADTKKSYQWLERLSVNDNTEALIIAARQAADSSKLESTRADVT